MRSYGKEAMRSLSGVSFGCTAVTVKPASASSFSAGCIPIFVSCRMDAIAVRGTLPDIQAQGTSLEILHRQVAAGGDRASHNISPLCTACKLPVQ